MKLLHAALATLLLSLACPAQSSYADFVKAFDDALKFNNEQEIDRAIRTDPSNALDHFAALCSDLRLRGDTSAETSRAAMRGSWTRLWKDTTILERVQRFIERQSERNSRVLESAHQQLTELHRRLGETEGVRERTPFEVVRDDALQLARVFEEYGDLVKAAETWQLVAQINSAIPDKEMMDRVEVVSALRRFKELRDNWGWTQDPTYNQSVAYLKDEMERVAAAREAAAEREKQGYAANVTGIDALVLPNVEEQVSELKFAVQRSMELDMYVKGGSLSLMWPSVALLADFKKELPGFKKTTLYLLRPKSNKFEVTMDGAFEPDPSNLTAIKASSRPKPSQFYLDEAKTQPYAMWFFVGGERERYMMAEMNMMPLKENAEVFFRSAASWRTSIAGETVTFYDDNCDGLLFSEDPFDHGTRLRTLGEVTEEGIAVPAYDSMRIGRNDRVPFSSITKIGDTWYHLRGVADNEKVGVRPLNPAFLKTGQVQLVWGGSKRTTPEVLIIQGREDLQSAAFDISSGDPVEVPVGEYQIGFGRIVVGRGGRMLMASIFQGDSEPFTVREGETLELDMGAPFHIDFVREGEGTQLRIEATKLRVLDRLGAVYTYLHGGVLDVEVVASRRADGRGARKVGGFVPIIKGNDPILDSQRLLGREALAFPKATGGGGGRGRGGGGLGRSADGRIGNIAPGSQIGGGRRARATLTLTVRLPAEGMVVGIKQLKHPLFGNLDPVFK